MLEQVWATNHNRAIFTRESDVALRGVILSDAWYSGKAHREIPGRCAAPLPDLDAAGEQYSSYGGCLTVLLVAGDDDQHAVVSGRDQLAPNRHAFWCTSVEVGKRAREELHLALHVTLVARQLSAAGAVYDHGPFHRSRRIHDPRPAGAS